ncbi:DUF6597 domain-containing transcriptional factor [Aquimarina hainanensis]|uniref:DUF6597 domain-containing transcriptional factor n=1 Tax=Aquimarina hainanensis TaxID=1578017 RepID=A0ABW5N9W2_9FLAO
MKPTIHSPSSDLVDFVMSYWTLESSQDLTPTKNTIIPDGTMKLIFHFGDLYKHHPKTGNSFLLPRCFLIGQLTQPYIVEPTGITGTFIVRFHPNGFLPFTSIPIHQMENTAVPLHKLFGEKGMEIENDILTASSNSERIHHIESFLRTQLNTEEVADRIVKAAIETIATTNGHISIHELSKQRNLNRRILSRKFSSSVGLSPKQLSKIVRLQATLKTLLHKKETKLTQVALENSYFDQAHFIKDFKEFTGVTPKEFYGNSLKMSLIFDSQK